MTVFISSHFRFKFNQYGGFVRENDDDFVSYLELETESKAIVISNQSNNNNNNTRYIWLRPTWNVYNFKSCRLRKTNFHRIFLNNIAISGKYTYWIFLDHSYPLNWEHIQIVQELVINALLQMKWHLSTTWVPSYLDCLRCVTNQLIFQR